MIGLPVMAVATVDVLARSDQLSPKDQVQLWLGDAQAEVRVETPGVPILQDERAQGVGSVGEPDPASPVKPDDSPEALADTISDMVGPGNVLVTSSEGGVRLTMGDRAIDTNGVELNSSDGWLGNRKLLEGRSPSVADEVAISAPLARHAGLAVGDQITMDDATQSGTSTRLLHVVAILEAPDFSREVIGRPGSLWANDKERQRHAVSTTWFVRGPAAVTWDQVQRLNAFGATAVSRAVVLDPPPRDEIPYYAEFGNLDAPSSETVTAAAVIAGLVVLEVALLAGPAFAVGARRNRRQLALVTAAGGEKRHVRAVVLAGGVVIGLGASVIGVLAGVALAAALRPVLRHYEIAYLPSLHVRPVDLLALVVVGSSTAVAAALVPAIQASRQDVVAALAGRRGQVKVRVVVPVIGAVVAVLGTALAVFSAVSRQRTGVLAGAALAELGLVATTGLMVAALGRTARWLPLSGRIAVRDAARQRGRTAPAVAAVMTAVAGCVASGLVMTSDDARWERLYEPSAPVGAALLQVGMDPMAREDPAVVRSKLTQAAQILQATLPVSDVVPLAGLRSANADEELNIFPMLNPERECPLYNIPYPTAEQMRQYASDERCDTFVAKQSTALGMIVDDGTAVSALTGRDDPEVREALARGAVVVPNPDQVWPDGTAHLSLDRYPVGGGDADIRELRVPAVAADLPGDLIVLSRSVLPEMEAEERPLGLIAPSTRVPTEAEEERSAAALAATGLNDHWFYVERGYVSQDRIAVLVLAGAALVIALGATGIAVGLAAAESRADLATLAAVGAAPRMRRRVAGGQGAVVAVLGTALGVVAGSVLGIVIVLMLRHGQPVPDMSWQLAVPWPELAALAVGIPVLATAAGFVFTRSRLPMVRRLGQ
jgi:putative ABC transport system permease protein